MYSLQSIENCSMRMKNLLNNLFAGCTIYYSIGSNRLNISCIGTNYLRFCHLVAVIIRYKYTIERIVIDRNQIKKYLEAL